MIKWTRTEDLSLWGLDPGPAGPGRARLGMLSVIDNLCPYPEYSQANSYPWSPFPPEAGPSRNGSSHLTSPPRDDVGAIAINN